MFPAPRSSSSFSGVQLLLTADGSSLSCSGSRVIPLRLGNHRFEWPFQLAPVAVPILGADFLKHYKLLLDVSNQRVFSADSPTSPSIILPTSPDSTSAPLKANLLATPKCISDLLAEFPDVVSSDGFTASKPRPPVFAKARRLDPEKLASVKKEFSAMEKAGIIRRSNSPWSSPLHMVKKKDGGWRPCGDYRGLNIVTVPNRYPLPNIADFTTRVSGSTIFSKLNLQKGYYQVPMAEEDICKTAIITLFGMFEFLRLPFGLRNVRNTFQRMMDSILGDLPYCFTYVDDILVFSSSLEEHVEHLCQVFLLCRQHGQHQEPQRTTLLHQDPLNGDTSKTPHQEPERTTLLHQDPLNGDTSETPHQEYTFPPFPPNRTFTKWFLEAIKKNDVLDIEATNQMFKIISLTNKDFVRYNCSALRFARRTAIDLLNSSTNMYAPPSIPDPSANPVSPINPGPQRTTPLHQNPLNGDTFETPHQEYIFPPSPPNHPIQTLTKWFLEAIKKNDLLDIEATNQMLMIISTNADFVRYDCSALCAARRTAMGLLNSCTNQIL